MKITEIFNLILIFLIIFNVTKMYANHIKKQQVVFKIAFKIFSKLQGVSIFGSCSHIPCYQDIDTSISGLDNNRVSPAAIGVGHWRYHLNTGSGGVNR